MRRVRDLIAELRRRRVFRAAIAYGIAAFGSLQGAEVVVAALDLPRGVLRFVVALTLLGFPVAMVLAWFYDVEPAAPPAAASSTAGTSTPDAPPHRRLRKPTWAVIGLLAVAAAGITAWARLRPEPAVGERIPIAVVDFANETSDPELNGLSGMLITSLEQSRRLLVLTRARMIDVLRQLGRPDVERIDEALAREVARTAGVKALVLASVHRFDEIYAIELKVLDPATDEYLFTLEERGRGKASVPELIDRLSERTRERLRERPSDVDASRVRVAEAITTSLDAYAHYFRGLQHADASRYEPALAEYRKAVELDPGFSLARFMIAYEGEFANLDPALREADLRRALQDRARLPEKERLLVEAYAAHRDGRDGDAERLYADAAVRYPLDKQVQYLAGDHLLHRGARDAEALRYFERAVALDPTWEPGVGHALDALDLLGRTGDALALAHRWADATDKPVAWAAVARAELRAGRLAEALAVGRKAVDRDGSVFVRRDLANVLLHADRFEEAEEVLRPAAGPDAPASERWRALASLATVVAYQGRGAEGRRIIDALPAAGAVPRLTAGLRLAQALGDGVPIGPIAAELEGLGVPPGELATLLAWSGDLDAAVMRADRLPASPAERDLYAAVVAWRRGDRADAAPRFEALTRRAEHDFAAMAYLALGEMALGEGRFVDADEAFERFARARVDAIHWGTTPTDGFRSYFSPHVRAWAYPRSLYERAVALAELGELERARETLDHLLALWRRADPDAPLLRDAKALRARLGAAPPAARAGRRAATP